MTNLADLSVTTLKRLIALSESRDGLLAALNSVEAEMAKVAGGAAPAMATPVAKPGPGRKSRRGRRGGVSEKILEALRAVGAKGIGVADLAKQLGMKPTNVSVWLGTTGKKSKLVQKVDRGVYRIAQTGAVASSTPVTAPAKATKPAPIAKRSVKKRKLSPEGRARIVAALKARWAAKKAVTKAKK